MKKHFIAVTRPFKKQVKNEIYCRFTEKSLRDSGEVTLKFKLPGFYGAQKEKQPV